MKPTIRRLFCNEEDTGHQIWIDEQRRKTCIVRRTGDLFLAEVQVQNVEWICGLVVDEDEDTIRFRPITEASFYGRQDVLEFWKECKKTKESLRSSAGPLSWPGRHQTASMPPDPAL